MTDQCQTTKSVPRDVPVSSGLAIAVLSVLAATGTLATNILLPSLPRIAISLNVTSAAVTSAITVFLAVFGIGQLLVGPLSDRYGRIPVYIKGIGITAAALKSALQTGTIATATDTLAPNISISDAPRGPIADHNFRVRWIAPRRSATAGMAGHQLCHWHRFRARQHEQDQAPAHGADEGRKARGGATHQIKIPRVRVIEDMTAEAGHGNGYCCVRRWSIV